MSASNSKYALQEYQVSYDKSLAEKWKPEIYDPWEYGKDHNPRIYFRALRYGEETCLQYYYYWDKQVCNRSYILLDVGTISLIYGALVLLISSLALALLSTVFAITIPTFGDLIYSGIFLLGSVFGYKFHTKIRSQIDEFIAGITLGRFFTHKYDFEQRRS